MMNKYDNALSQSIDLFLDMLPDNFLELSENAVALEEQIKAEPNPSVRADLQKKLDSLLDEIIKTNFADTDYPPQKYLS